MRRFVLPALLLVCLLGAGRGIAAQPEAELKSLLSDAWEFHLESDPVFATRFGDHRWDDRLSTESLSEQRRRLQQRRAFLARWEAIDRQQLSREDQINYDLFGQLLKDDIAEGEFERYLQPITNRSGFHLSFAELPNDMPLHTLRDYENYIARLRDFSRQTQDYLELMRLGIERGFTLPAVVLEGYQDTITPHIVDDPTKSLLYKPFVDLPARFSSADQERLRDTARQAISEHVVPSYARFLKFMKEEYLPACRSTIGASASPRGREYYRHRVRMFTTLDLTPEEVHATGQAEVQRIRAEMEAIIRKVGFQGTFNEFVQHLRTEPRFYAESAEELVKEASYVLKKMDGQLPRLFKTLPRTPYGIREIPSYLAPKTTTAYYQPPSGDGSQAGFYYLNTYNLKARPLYELEALSLHEAVPGHHLQIALQQELTNLPPFRRFASFTVFIEGWALYSERLGLEVGFYQDPYQDFGRLTYEMWRACRLVVDTGMHYLGWTREQAIRFMAENTALSLHNIQAEVDRYISWPGQALAYKIGELKIRELRQLAEKKLGNRFDVRDFHDVVLGSGAVPLTILEENVRDYLRHSQ